MFIFVMYPAARHTPLQKKCRRHSSAVANAIRASPGTSWYSTRLYTSTIGTVAARSHAHVAERRSHSRCAPAYTLSTNTR